MVWLGLNVSLMYGLFEPNMPFFGLNADKTCPVYLNVKVYVPICVGVYMLYVEPVGSEINGPICSVDPSGFTMSTKKSCYLSPPSPAAVGGAMCSHITRNTFWPTPTGSGEMARYAYVGISIGGLLALAAGKAANIIEKVSIRSNVIPASICFLFTVN